MSRKFLLTATVAAAFLLGIVATASLAAKHTVALTASDVVAHTALAPAGATCYTVAIPLPESIKGKELFGAYLELYLDVDAVERNGLVNETPYFDVHALESAFAGTVEEKQFGAPAFGPRNVVRGENRRVVLDITDIVEAYLDGSAANHGLIIGSLTGDRDGVFTVKSGLLDQGAVANLIFHFRDR